MAKIHPSTSRSNKSSSSSERETSVFTVWMKSLVFHGNGCTIFNSKGEVVFRVDNYQQRCSSEVFLMDSSGNILCSLYRTKKLGFIGDCWKGFQNSKPWFEVRRGHRILRSDRSCKVILKCHQDSCYRIVGLKGKSSLKIVDHFSGQILAEAIEKQSSVGVSLGEDVLTLKVEPLAHQPLIMALITVYGLINNRL